MYPRSHLVTITTNSTGAGTGYASVGHGRILSLQYASTTLATTGSVSYTNESTAEAIFTKAPAANRPTYYPRPTVCTSTGGAIKPSTGSAVPDYFYVSDHRVKIALVGCGATRTATFNIVIG